MDISSQNLKTGYFESKSETLFCDKIQKVDILNLKRENFSKILISVENAKKF